ncbi:MAG: S-adenosylmethionine:tRNA ribosyltransferase-isomerase [Actinomycetes bacterium]
MPVVLDEVAVPVAPHPATEPPEARGTARDEVRLLVAEPDRVSHAVFRDIGAFLSSGDVLVVNTSATLAAAVDARRAAGPVTLHFSTVLPDGTWAVELRPGRRATGPVMDVRAGEVVDLPGGARLRVLAPHTATAGVLGVARLWRCEVAVDGPVPAYLSVHGRPIAYDYVPADWPLTSYQTVFARDAGSAEMPSAGRPFSHSLVTDLATRGVAVAPVTLHTGVSSLEKDEAPLPERYNVPEATARLVSATRLAGGRVVAVGTTVTRALETVADASGGVHPGLGWTDLVLGPRRPARVVDGLVTGWHAPGASHLRLLEAVAGADLVATAYAAARANGYLWHEFGDSALFLP